MNERLIDLGFMFKQSQIWKTVFEEELFAIRLPEDLTLADGSEYVYCCIMGRNGEHRALSVYMGERGFASLRKINQITDENNLENLLSQDCIQCSIETEEQFLPDELSKIKAEAKKRKSRSPYPHFSRYKPNCIPWRITDPKDERVLILALEMTMALTDYLRDHPKDGTDLKRIHLQSTRDLLGDQQMMEPLLDEIDRAEQNQRIPVLTIRNGGLKTAEMIPLPGLYKPEYPCATVIDELKLKKLKKINKQGVLECQVARIPEPTKEESEEGAPYLPAILLSVDEDGMVRLPVMMRHAEYDPNEAIGDLMKGMIAEKYRPAEIHVRTEETRALLEAFCRKAEIRLEEHDDLEKLDEGLEEMMNRWKETDDDEGDVFGVDDLIEMLETIPEKELKKMPDFMIAQVVEAADSGLLPPKISEKVSRVAGKIGL